MIAPTNMGFGRNGALRYGGDAEPDDPGSGVRAEHRPVLGGDPKAPGPGSLWSCEPWATVRAEPTRFWIGVPLVFAGALGVALAFREVGFEVAVGVLLVAQALGFVALYVPALRKRTDPMRNPLSPRDDPSPIDRTAASGRARAPAADALDRQP